MFRGLKVEGKDSDVSILLNSIISEKLNVTKGTKIWLLVDRNDVGLVRGAAVRSVLRFEGRGEWCRGDFLVQK